MQEGERVRRLVEEVVDSGRTPEDVCRACPESLPAVLQALERLAAFEAEVSVLFPSRDPRPRERRDALPATELPAIPGYVVLGVFGRGGMGVVYKARHLKLGRDVAVKMLLMGDWAGPSEVARFTREARAIAALRHPHIIQVHDIGDLDGRQFFTMEFMEGGSLAQKLAGVPQPARDAATMVATLAEAVEVAHAGGIIHRDLKPANILLTAEGTPKISDFGLALSDANTSDVTAGGTRLGTPSYMSPEQAIGRPGTVGKATDIYALGAVLYEMLAGRPPFRADSPLETERQVIAEEPARPSRLNAKVPRDLEVICLKCLEKDPERRYPTAQALADDLGRFLRREPIAARPVGWLGRLVRLSRRRPAAALLVATAVLLAATGVVAAGLLYRHRAEARAREAATDPEVRGVLGSARGLLEEGWEAADLAKLTKARSEIDRAAEMARDGGASAGVRQETEALQSDAEARQARIERARALLVALQDVSVGNETRGYIHGEPVWFAQPSADELYGAAFRRFGLDVDGTAEVEVVARLGAEPDLVVQELVAAVDCWMLERRRERPEADWQRLYNVAEQLDGSKLRQRLRALLAGGAPASAAAAAEGGIESSMPGPGEPADGDTRRALLELAREIDPRTENVFTVELLARAFDEGGDAAEAERVLRQAVTARPGEVVLLVALGRLLERQGPSRCAEAIAYYQAARGQRPFLGIALGRALLTAGKADEAEEVLQELARQPEHDHDAVLFYNLGVTLYQRQKYAEAEAACRKAADLQPDLAEAHFNLGTLRLLQQRHGEAEAALRRALDLKPGWVEVETQLGTALNEQGKYGEAEAAYRKAIELAPDSAEAYNNLGNTLGRQGKPGAAEATLRKAIELDPDLAEAYINLGDALSDQGKRREAESAHRKGTQLRPDFAHAYYQLGNDLLAQQRYPEAETVFRKVIELQPDHAQSYTNAGHAVLRQGQTGPAEALLRKAIDLDPGLYEAHFNLGEALMRQARFDEALAALKQAGDLLPPDHRRRAHVSHIQDQCERYRALEAELSAVLAGTEEPADAIHTIEFARLCYFKTLYAAAARLYAEAFALAPALANEPRNGLCYGAACAAALAGCGRGEDGAEVDDAERARWREQALQWLQADLAARAEASDADSLRGVLLHWGSDRDLAGVRDKDALAEMSAEERERWERLWSDVDALLQRTDTGE